MYTLSFGEDIANPTGPEKLVQVFLPCVEGFVGGVSGRGVGLMVLSVELVVVGSG